MKVKTHESQNAEEGYVFRLSALETILQNIKVIHTLELLSLDERPSCQQNLVSTSRMVLKYAIICHGHEIVLSR